MSARQLALAVLAAIGLTAFSAPAALAATTQLSASFNDAVVYTGVEPNLVPSIANVSASPFGRLDLKLLGDGTIGAELYASAAFIRAFGFSSADDAFNYSPNLGGSLPAGLAAESHQTFGGTFSGGFYCDDCGGHLSFSIGRTGGAAFTSIDQLFGGSGASYRFYLGSEGLVAGDPTFFQSFASPVPEPAEWLMLASGLGLLAGRRRNTNGQAAARAQA